MQFIAENPFTELFKVRREQVIQELNQRNEEPRSNSERPKPDVQLANIGKPPSLNIL